MNSRPAQSVAVFCSNSDLRHTIVDVLETRNCCITEADLDEFNVDEVGNFDRLILSIAEGTYQLIEKSERLLNKALENDRCALLIREDSSAAEKLLQKVIPHDFIKQTRPSDVEGDLKSWLKQDILFILPIGGSTSEQRDKFDSLANFLLASGYRLRKRKLNELEWNAISDNMAECDKVVAAYFKPPGKIPSHARGHLYQLAFNRMVSIKKKVMCIVKMYANPADSGEDTVLKNHRIDAFIQVFDSPDEEAIRTWLADESNLQVDNNLLYGSLGSGLAWQFAIGFLAYILPNLQDELRKQLLDDNGYIKEEILKKYRILSDIQPRKITVLQKYFLLLNEDHIDSMEHVNPNPDQLWSSCEKICELCPTKNKDVSLELVFKSPAYPKMIPLYLMKLSPQSGDSEYTHAVILGGFAPPVSVIRELRQASGLKLTNDLLHSAYVQFKEELRFILNHPKANKLLEELRPPETDMVEQGNADKTACIVERERSQSDEDWNKLLLTRVQELIRSDQLSKVMRQPIGDKACGKSSEDMLVVKFSKSVKHLYDAVANKLEDEKFFVMNFEEKIKTYPQVLIQCRKMVLFASLDDLERFNEEYNAPNYTDADHNNLLQHLTSAVTYIHMRQEYNLLVVVITNEIRRDIYPVLPAELRILPESNVVSIVNLSADSLDSIQYAFTEGETKVSTFSGLIQRLKLREDCIKVDDYLPLMSMACALAANSFGFAYHIVQCAKNINLPLPYKYVVPQSGRFPDEEKLKEKLKDLGISFEKVWFENEGRRYCIAKWKQDSSETAVGFEVPACVLHLRKQATKCSGLGGIKSATLRQNLQEYIRVTKTMLESMQWEHKFMEILLWPDEQFKEAWRDPTLEYAKSLLDLVFSSRSVPNLSSMSLSSV